MVPLDSPTSRPSSDVAQFAPYKMAPRSRTQSISSDRPSTVAHSLMSPPLAVSPEAAFIAASAASQIVTNDHDSHADAWYDQHGIEPSGEPAAVSPAALQLVNNFLDQLLFNFLSVSRSTSLAALRPAVSEVLKPKLAKDAINQADEELREYLGGDDEDATQDAARGPVSPADWDLELVWKRTRLRCMVYSSLGDMEEEDEDFYMEQGYLDAGPDDRLSEVVSPAVAIFLTSILEFMGEQALVVAGQAAYHRMRLRYEKELKEGARSPADLADRVLVEELDMERVALDRTLGRLWRAWKKKIRSPGIASIDRLARSYSRDSMRGATGHLRSPSSAVESAVPATVPEPEAEVESKRVSLVTEEKQQHVEEPEAAPPQPEDIVMAAEVPLPEGPWDVAEIEMVGLACYSDDDEDDDDDDAKDALPVRPKSLMVIPVAAPELATPTLSQPHTPVLAVRKRANSLPTPAATPFGSPVETTQDATVAQDAAEEPKETQVAEDAAAIDDHETDIEDDDDDDEDDEVFVEEPQILTSSRVSISGRSISPASSERGGKPMHINTNLPVRTPSIHSARLIEVVSPRSPVIASQRASADVSDMVRQSALARLSGTPSPPVPVPVQEGARRSPDGLSSNRLSVSHAAKSGLVRSESISEAEENADADYTVSPITPVTPAAQSASSLPSIPEPVPAPVTAPVPEPAQKPVPEAVRKPSPERVPAYEKKLPEQPRVPPTSAPASRTPPPTVMEQRMPPTLTKVTILPPSSSSSSTSTSFFIESMPVLPEKPVAPERTRQSPQRQQQQQQQAATPPAPAPAVPERSAGRQVAANTSAPLQPIGQVTVERSRNRSPPEQYSRPPDHTAAAPSWQQGSPSSSAKLKAPVRTSEEAMTSRIDRIDVVRNFEELIQSDQTIQYTLTPESMRELDNQSNRSRKANGSPVIPVKTRKSDEARQNGNRSRSSSGTRPGDAKPPSNSRSASTSDAQPGGNSRTYAATTPAGSGMAIGVGGRPGVVPRSMPPVPSKPRPNAPLARDARMPRESLAEFADFIRSTGPHGGPAVPAGAVGGAPGTIPSVRPSHALGSKASIDSGKASVASSNPGRPRLQARTATVDYKDDNSDLIDFIRRGPPNTGGNPRIPKAVAPFRTTMDSDQLTGAVGGKAVDAQLREAELRTSQASTNAEYSKPPSVQSSANSQSALLRNKPLPGSGPGGFDDDEMPMPKRKTRRVRDPYAIDISDEDEEMDLVPQPKRRAPPKEESLMDFLNSVPPPPDTPVQPFVTTASTRQERPRKKASAPSLMARFTRRDGGAQAAAPTPPRSPPTTTTMESRSLSSRAGGGRGYIPIQVNVPPTGADRLATTFGGAPTGKAAAMMGMGGVGGGGGGPRPVGIGGGGGGRVPMKKFEPREAVSVSSRETSDLADFFKHSGPPPGMGVVSRFPEPPPPPEESSSTGGGGGNGMRRVFGRRKKGSVS